MVLAIRNTVNATALQFLPGCVVSNELKLIASKSTDTPFHSETMLQEDLRNLSLPTKRSMLLLEDFC